VGGGWWLVFWLAGGAERKTQTASKQKQPTTQNANSGGKSWVTNIYSAVQAGPNATQHLPPTTHHPPTTTQ